MESRSPGNPSAPAQDWDPDQYATNARFVSDLGGAVLDLLAPQAGERILDLGCGDGALTVEIKSRGADVVAVDASPDQIREARRRGLDARVMNGHMLTFEGEFDAVFSNAALHWMPETPKVLAGVHRALRPRGRFVAEMGGAGNVVKILGVMDEVLSARGYPGLQGHPWHFPSPEEYAAQLRAAGFEVAGIELVPRPTRLPGDIGGWLDTFCEAFFRVLPEAERNPTRSEMILKLEPLLADKDGVWWADYVRLRFSARRTA